MGLKRNAGSDPETGGLTQRERDHNAEVTRARIGVEHVIGDIKRYALMRKRYGGTPEQFNDELNVVTGLVNLKRMWDGIKSKEDPSLLVHAGSLEGALTLGRPGAARTHARNGQHRTGAGRLRTPS